MMEIGREKPLENLVSSRASPIIEGIYPQRKLVHSLGVFLASSVLLDAQIATAATKCPLQLCVARQLSSPDLPTLIHEYVTP